MKMQMSISPIILSQDSTHQSSLIHDKMPSNLLYLGLMILTSLTVAVPTIDTELGPTLITGPKETIKDFAILNQTLGKLPTNFTLCSSVTTDALTGRLNPFQLLQDNGEPWITFFIFAAQRTATQHRIMIMVSFSEIGRNMIKVHKCRLVRTSSHLLSKESRCFPCSGVGSMCALQ